MSEQAVELIAIEHEFESGDEIDDDDTWIENEDEQEPTKCLFCDEMGTTLEKAIEHLDKKHHINLSDVKHKFNLDQYSYIKMINYIKTQKLTSEGFKKIDQVLWHNDEYMKPVEVDAWLMFDIEDLIESVANVKISEAHQIQNLERQLKEKDALVTQLLERINEMKSNFQAWIERTENGPESEMNASGNDDIKTEFQEPTHVARIPILEDESYFITYAHFDIHYDMLSDTVRTNSYREAILRNRNSFENKLVMDVGCGTAILSMFSAQAGAKKVIAIDQSEIIYHAMDIAQRNQIKNIEFAKGRLENMNLPLEDGEKVDIIVSEWMGYFLLFEGMLDSVIHARDKYLKSGGLLLPNRCTINLLAFGDEERHSEYIGFWNDVYGFDMNVMQSKMLKEAIVETCRSEYILSDSVIIADLNMHQVGYMYPNFTYDFELKIRKSGKFTAFVGFFDTFFDLPQSIEFTTGPHSKPTHWRQVVFYIKDPIVVSEGDVISGRFECKRGKKDARALSIKIVAFNQEFYYSLN